MTPIQCQRLLSAVVLLFASNATFAHAEDTWTEVRSPHFRVLTDGSAGAGRNVAVQFEQMRHVFAQQFRDENIGAGAPLTIIAAHDENTFKTLEPHEWKATGGNLGGEFHRGWEKQFATIRLDTGEMSEAVVLHEYTHSILHARAHWLPIWMDEGFAEFYGSTRFESNRTLVGNPDPRAAILRNSFMLPTAEMLDTANEAKLLRDPTKANLFYAEAWAMVHFMMFGPGMDGGVKLNSFFKKLQGGEPEKTAFNEVFGDNKVFDDALSNYVRAFSFKAAVLPVDDKVDAKVFAVRKLAPAETEYELGAFQIGSGETALGRARLEKALALDPKLAGAHEELAFLLYREGKDAEAEKEWKVALELDPNRPRSIFALSMTGTPLMQQTSEQLVATEASLQHVLELSPGFAPAYVELSLAEWRQGHLQKAFEDVHKAEGMEPWRAGYHILAGRILLAGRQPGQAATSARFVADRWSGPDHNEAVDLWNDVPASDRGEGAALKPDVPAGATVVRGTLTELTCGSAPADPMVVTVTPSTPGASPLTFKSDGRFVVGFSDSFWWGEDHFSRCHHLTGHPVTIAYLPEKQRLLDLEVRDDLPPAQKPVAQAAASAAH